MTDALFIGPNGENLPEDAFPFGKPEGPKGGTQAKAKGQPKALPAGTF